MLTTSNKAPAQTRVTFHFLSRTTILLPTEIATVKTELEIYRISKKVKEVPPSINKSFTDSPMKTCCDSTPLCATQIRQNEKWLCPLRSLSPPDGRWVQ